MRLLCVALGVGFLFVIMYLVAKEAIECSEEEEWYE